MTIIDVKNDYVLRDASAISPVDDYIKLLSIINNNDDIKKYIIETQIQSKDNDILKHRKINHIIHSGEFTSSMAYDVTNIAINLTLNLLQYGIFANDLLAHNFTFENGQWILYDFCSFSYNSKGLKTQIRGTFNISFSSFELLNIIPRKKLKHYFLNRIKYSNLIKMISFPCWLNWYINMLLTLFMNDLKMYKLSILFLKRIYEKYSKKYKRRVYNYIINEENKFLYNYIDTIVNKNSDVLCLGKCMGDWALYSSNNCTKIYYTDNYDECDEYYNYIVQNKIKNISTAVFQPLAEDEKLQNDLKYRALYDNFTVKRLSSRIVLVDFEKIYDERYKTLREFCSTIQSYSKEYTIIKLSKNKILADRIQDEMRKYFEYSECIDCGKYYILVERSNISAEKVNDIRYYGNDNRSKEAKSQCYAIIDIIKNK